MKILFLLVYFIETKFKAINKAGEREREKMWEAEQERRRLSLGEETSK